MARLIAIEQEPKIGPSIHELARERQYQDFYQLDDAADLTRPAFFFPDSPSPGIGPFGQYMLSAGFRRYRTEAVVAYALDNVHMIGTDGIIVLDGGVLRNTLDYISTWLPDSCVEEFRRAEYLRLRRTMPVSGFIEDGRYVIGFTGAWRNYAHWLLQCLPKLYAFTQLRRRFRDLKAVLPPLQPHSVQQRTLDLLGIGPDAVFTLPPGEVTGFAAAIVLPTFDIWSVTPFAAAAAEHLVASLPAPTAGAATPAERIYLHRMAHGRQIANFDAVRAVVERFGFVVHSFETMDLAGQIEIMRGARCVISEHDDASASILFCRPGARILELFNPFCVQPGTWSIAARRGLDYGYLVGNHSATAEHPLPGWNSAFTMPLDTLDSALRVMVNETVRPAATAAGIPTAPTLVAAIAVPPTMLPVQASASGPVHITGIAEPIFEVMADVGRFGHGGGAERLTVFAPALPPAQHPIHRESDIGAEFVAEHYQYAAPQSVNVYALAGAVLWGNGLVTHGTQFVAPPDCMPSYFRPQMQPNGPSLPAMHAGALGRADAQTLALDHPVAVALHPNLVYGHFLLEMLPRLYLLMVLRQFGADFPLALSSRLPPWVKTFARMFQPDDRIVWYDHTTHRVTAPSIVIPAMMHTDHNFHPAMNLMLHDMVQQQRLAGTAAMPGAPLIYVSRSNFGEERLENEDQVEEMVTALGFTVVRPQQLSVEEQIRMFSAAEIIVGEYGSGLHNAIFAGPGTRIVAINFFNNYQSKIARLRRHRLAFVPPRDGRFRHWRLTRDLPRKFSVDINLLRRTVLEMLEGAT